MTLPTLDLANADFVTDHLLVGGDLAFDDEHACDQAVELIDAGVTHVLDVRLECDDAALWACAPEVTYRWDGIDDAGQRLPAAWFEGITAWAVHAIEAGGVVLTHCHMGINRGPSAGYAVLLALGWDPVEALDAIRTVRPIAHIWYAEGALEWHLARVAATAAERHATRRRVRQWRRENPLDVVGTIHRIRMDEGA